MLRIVRISFLMSMFTCSNDQGRMTAKYHSGFEQQWLTRSWRREAFASDMALGDFFAATAVPNYKYGCVLGDGIMVHEQNISQ